MQKRNTELLFRNRLKSYRNVLKYYSIQEISVMVKQTLNLISARQHRPLPTAKQQWIQKEFEYSNLMC